MLKTCGSLDINFEQSPTNNLRIKNVNPKSELVYFVRTSSSPYTPLRQINAETTTSAFPYPDMHTRIGTEATYEAIGSLQQVHRGKEANLVSFDNVLRAILVRQVVIAPLLWEAEGLHSPVGQPPLQVLVDPIVVGQHKR